MIFMDQVRRLPYQVKDTPEKGISDLQLCDRCLRKEMPGYRVLFRIDGQCEGCDMIGVVTVVTPLAKQSFGSPRPTAEQEIYSADVDYDPSEG